MNAGTHIAALRFYSHAPEEIQEKSPIVLVALVVIKRDMGGTLHVTTARQGYCKASAAGSLVLVQTNLHETIPQL